MELVTWKDIKGFPGYQVSSIGEIKSLDRYVKHPTIKTGTQFVAGTLRKLASDKDGYNCVLLSNGSKRKLCKVHRLVAEAFIINNQNFPCVNHLNSVRNDNRVENLEWTDNSGNQRHCFRTGRRNMHGENHTQNKLKEIDIYQIVCDLMNGFKMKDIAEKYNVSRTTIYGISRVNSWHITMRKIAVDLIKSAKDFLVEENKKYPCVENSITITKLEEALMWDKERTKNREARGVEGTSEA